MPIHPCLRTLKIDVRRTDNAGIVPSPPDLFVIDLLPLPDCGFDRKQVMTTPVVAWEIDGRGEAKPVIPGLPMGDRWSVLTPAGFVITNKFTSLGYRAPIKLRDLDKIPDRMGGGPYERDNRLLNGISKSFEYSRPFLGLFGP